MITYCAFQEVWNKGTKMSGNLVWETPTLELIAALNFSKIQSFWAIYTRYMIAIFNQLIAFVKWCHNVVTMKIGDGYKNVPEYIWCY